MDWMKYKPNRVRAQFSTNSTSWQLIGMLNGGTGYDSYAALIAAGDKTFPGSVTDFPIGIPDMIARSVASGGTTDGSPFQIMTNTVYTPTAEDDLVSGSGQTLTYKDDCIKQVWVKKSAGTDIVVLTGFF